MLEIRALPAIRYAPKRPRFSRQTSRLIPKGFRRPEELGVHLQAAITSSTCLNASFGSAGTSRAVVERPDAAAAGRAVSDGGLTRHPRRAEVSASRYPIAPVRAGAFSLQPILPILRNCLASPKCAAATHGDGPSVGPRLNRLACASVGCPSGSVPGSYTCC